MAEHCLLFAFEMNLIFGITELPKQIFDFPFAAEFRRKGKLA
jgi:hypothetical protein